MTLTVKELIEKLKTMDPEAIVVSPSSNFEIGSNALVDPSVYQFKGKIVEQTFRDAFDGGSYNKKVYEMAFDTEPDFDKAINLVKIGG